jgi:hypothetical protein
MICDGCESSERTGMERERMARNLKEISTEKLFNELDTTIARLQAERDKSRELLSRLINNIETGSRESIVQCIDECKRALMI